VGVISRASLEQALRAEVAEFGALAVAQSLEHAMAAWEAMAPHAGAVAEGVEPRADTLAAPAWIDLPFEPATVSAPSVHGTATSVQVRTGLWRTMRPVIDHERCHRCTWICTTFCPDAAIGVDAQGAPAIDYDHCKGCLVCVAVCPPHAIRAVPERDAERGASAPAAP
jgi:pyruvate ferredoxin oxidoreductase gamma subunit